MNTIQNTAQANRTVLVLLAEDDPDQSEMLKERLEDAGYKVETAARGDVAMKLLQERDFGVAIMDARMPGLHGGTVLKVCKGLGGAIVKTPIIMVSAFATPEDIERYKLDGAVATFAKPLNFNRLLSCLREVIS